MQERQEKLKLIVQTNTHTWSHINLKGTYDFTEHENFMSFDLDLLSKLDLRAGRLLIRNIFLTK
ncbi:hypothetical protein [Dyadobacter sp. 3J3]|uniref:hypothetical protein n=1 Tax=Dyadobacter sp. 3J3 TaxID=2606600 RepID=UPI00190FB3FF|nr:hypothetical protein [Dyadobacter sp. 3J3]